MVGNIIGAANEVGAEVMVVGAIAVAVEKAEVPPRPDEYAAHAMVKGRCLFLRRASFS
jgi:hypothetical protein